MKAFKFHIILSALVICAALSVFLLQAPKSSGLAQERKTGSSVKTTAIVREKPAAAKETPTGAAAQNLRLRSELSWVFGGKTQRGWYLYQSLIGSTLNTDHDADSDDFASAVAKWQQKSGLKSTGILDTESLYALVSFWQGRRLKNKTPAQPDQLIVAPTTDFYDPSRVDELRQVEKETFAAYKRMVAAAVTDTSLKLSKNGQGGLAPEEKFLKIISSFRSREYQEKLRRESPHAGSAGLAVNSPHFTGKALDLYVGGEPVETKDANRAIQVNTPVYKWLVRNAERFGFRPYYYEPWHWEYVK